MGKGKKGRFKLRGRQIDTRRQHPPEIAGKKSGIAFCGRCIVSYLGRGEEDRKHGTDAVDPDGNLPCLQRDPASRHRPAVICASFSYSSFFPFKNLQGGDPRRHGHRVPGEGAGLIDRADGRQLFHDFLATAKGPHGQPPADDLSQAGQIRIYAGKILEAAVGKTKARDYLVKNKQDAVFFREFP